MLVSDGHMHPEDRSTIRFAEKIVTLLERGGFSATYKYAVLLALMDLCMEFSARDGAAPVSLTTRQLARRVLELYWPHTREFEGRVVLQNRGGQAEILSLILAFRAADPATRGSSLYRARLAAPDAFGALEREIEWKLVEMPLTKLQRVGRSGVDPFLYVVNWEDGIKRRQFTGNQFDNRILFQPGASQDLVSLGGVLRPLVHRHWSTMVTRLNHLPESELEDFLFGRERVSLAPVCGALLDLQDGLCFYCRKAVRAKTAAQVDHFVPWARHADDGLDNLVVAHGECNGDKSDFLADAGHVRRWSERIVDRDGALAKLASEVRWERNTTRTASVLRAVYRNVADDAWLWHAHRQEFARLDRGTLVDALEMIPAMAG